MFSSTRIPYFLSYDNYLTTQGYPTTFFVDKTGKVIGKLQIGTPADEGKIADAYLELINDALSSVK